MPSDRYYHQDHFCSGEKISLRDQEFHHLAHVMRAQVGENIELVNGEGSLAHAKILTISKKEGVLEIISVETKKKPEFEVILAQAIPRTNRLDFILEKGTELGVTQFWLFPGKLSEKKMATISIEKLKNQAIASMKQCGRLYVPEIQILSSLKELKELPYPAFFGDTEKDAPEFYGVWEKPKDGVIFFIGPESGFTTEETDFLLQLGVKGVKLNDNILRVDTAALVAISLIGHRLGRTYA